MPLVATPAIILHVMPYSETSKIVRLLARDLGLQSAIAKGARRAKSRTGPRLDLFASGTATLTMKGHRELNPLTSFDITSAHAGLSHDVTRFAAASALAELVLKCVPAEPHPEVFDAASAGLDAIEHAPSELLETAALVACWGLVVALGFSPTLDRCAVCGVPTEGSIRFSAAQGGALCASHGTEAPNVTRLKRPDREALAALIAGRLPEAALDPRHAAAHRKLLMAFVRHHLAEDRPLPALAFWDAESWNATSS
jgi:DNA repair protein RecO (recombination protein O)